MTRNPRPWADPDTPDDQLTAPQLRHRARLLRRIGRKQSDSDALGIVLACLAILVWLLAWAFL